MLTIPEAIERYPEVKKFVRSSQKNYLLSVTDAHFRPLFEAWPVHYLEQPLKVHHTTDYAWRYSREFSSQARLSWDDFRIYPLNEQDLPSNKIRGFSNFLGDQRHIRIIKTRQELPFIDWYKEKISSLVQTAKDNHTPCLWDIRYTGLIYNPEDPENPYIANPVEDRFHQRQPIYLPTLLYLQLYYKNTFFYFYPNGLFCFKADYYSFLKPWYKSSANMLKNYYRLLDLYLRYFVYPVFHPEAVDQPIKTPLFTFNFTDNKEPSFFEVNPSLYNLFYDTDPTGPVNTSDKRVAFVVGDLSDPLEIKPEHKILENHKIQVGNFEVWPENKISDTMIVVSDMYRN